VYEILTTELSLSGYRCLIRPLFKLIHLCYFSSRTQCVGYREICVLSDSFRFGLIDSKPPHTPHH
jgi:hypothetical protein